MSQRSGILDFPSNCKLPEQPEPALDKVIQGFSTALNELKEIIKELTFRKKWRPPRPFDIRLWSDITRSFSISPPVVTW